jgi:hypothetical protein
MTCQCEKGTAENVAACDTEGTRCCSDPSTACERFCEANHQKWTGRFTPEASSAPAPPAAAAPATAASSSACAEPCQKAEDCPTMTCQCENGTAENVAACGATSHCCGNARVVCEHYCGGKKGKWTGKVASDAPASSNSNVTGPLLDLDDDDYLRQP